MREENSRQTLEDEKKWIAALPDPVKVGKEITKRRKKKEKGHD